MPQFTTTVIAVAFILLAVGAVIGLLVLLYDWLAPLISRTTHGVSLPDSIGDLVSRLRRRRSRDDEEPGGCPASKQCNAVRPFTCATHAFL
jgi:two-component system, OmpR family, sensor histidine kinase SenX3